jgi:hypothetical protein
VAEGFEMRILAILLSSSVVLGCIYFAVLLKHAKAHGLTILSRENLIGSLPLFAVVAGIAVFVVIGLMAESKAGKESKTGHDR